MTDSEGWEPPDDNQDKLAWCDFGEQRERMFLERIWNSGIGITRNPSKATDRFSYDALITLPCDIKTVLTPFNSAQELYGVDRRYAVTLNRKDVERYAALYPGIILVFNIAHIFYTAIHYGPLTQIQRMIKHGKCSEHFYQHRVVDDGNAQSSYVFDVRYLPVLCQPQQERS
jgi:hypothetical protein